MSDDTAPRRGYLIALAIYVVAVLALGHPALAGQFLVNPHSDEYIAGYAFREYGASMLRVTGGFPLWNPYLFGGMPFVAAMHGDIFYPIFLLRMAVPTDVAMTWTFIIHLIVAGIATYAFLRAAGFTFAGALLGGLAYMLGGQLASLVSPGHDGKLYVSAMFPLALLLLLRWIRDGARWAPGALAIVVGLAVLSPHPQLLQYMLLASGAYALFLAVRSSRGGDISARGAAARLGVALAAVVVGGLIGAIQYLPVSEYVAWSPRATGMTDYAHATSYAWPPEELLDAYLPQFSGILDAYWGRNMIHFHSQYVGASVLVLAFAAFAGASGDSRRSEIWFWTGALVVALLWALGGHTPFYRLPYTIVPGTKFFRAPATVFFVGALALAYLAGIGTERLLERKMGVRYLVGWGIAAVVIALLATVGVLTGIAQALGPEQTIDRVLANQSAVIFGAWRSLFFVAAVLALAVVLQRGRLRPAAAVWVLAGVVALDQWSVMRHYWLFSPPAEQLYAPDATIEYLRAQEQPARVLALDIPPGSSGRDANLVGDGLMVHRIRTTLGYHGNQLARYDVLAGKTRGYQNIANPRFWELTNTQYLLSNVDSLPLSGAVRVAGPVTSAAGTRVSLFRLPGEQPYAWVAPLIVKAPDEPVLGTIMDPRFDVRTAALFDTSAAVRGVENVQTLPAPLEIAATVTSYAPGRVAIALDAPAPEGAALVVSENYYPGWSATADGREAITGRVNLTSIGVELPTGARTVQLTFASAPYEKGKLITLISLAAALILAAAGAVMERMRGRRRHA
jgi:hypothetical protein